MEQSSPQSVPRLAAVGQLIGDKYRVLSCLGRGGMGEVLLAEELGSSRTVAIKVLATRAINSENIARFLREARVMARLSSEHVAAVLDVGVLDWGLPFIVMEHLRGLDLGCLLDAFGPMSVKEAVTSVLQASRALAQAHAMGIVHRDLKPQNLFLTQRDDGSWFVKVLDFGVSKISDGIPCLTTTGDVFGTPGYMSPEQTRSAKLVDARTDIWALGLILAECLSGQPVYQGKHPLDVIAAVAEGRPVLQLGPDTPPALMKVILRCLQRDPAERYQSVSELAQDLLPFLDGGSTFVPSRLGPLLDRAPVDDETPTMLLATPGAGGTSGANSHDAPTLPASTRAPELRVMRRKPKSTLWLAAVGAAVALCTMLPARLAKTDVRMADTVTARVSPSNTVDVVPAERSSVGSEPMAAKDSPDPSTANPTIETSASQPGPSGHKAKRTGAPRRSVLANTFGGRK